MRSEFVGSGGGACKAGMIGHDIGICNANAFGGSPNAASSTPPGPFGSCTLLLYYSPNAARQSRTR